MKIIVIGGGVAGLSIGWRLAQAGAQVTVLERDQSARNATWASAGMIAVAGELGGADTPEADMARRAQNLWPDFAKEIEESSGTFIDYRRNGSLMVAMNDEMANAMSSRAVTDASVQWIGPQQARNFEPLLAPDIRGALWAPNESQVDTRKLLRALMAAFTNVGGHLTLGQEVLCLDRAEGNVVAARTATECYHGDMFVLAAGAWSKSLDESVAIRPIKGEIISFAPPSEAAMPKHVVWGDGIYLVPRINQLIAGATMVDVGFDTAPTADAAERLSARARQLMPALNGWDIADQWAGLRPQSPDKLPLLGPTHYPNLYVATGQFRNGILFAPYIAALLRDQVLHHSEQANHFDPRRFAMA